MKNLTRVLVLALVFSMILSSVAFAATFTDVEDGTALAEATDVLAALDILKGDPDGNFRPNDTITRAEVVAIANRLQGLSDAASGAAGQSIYTDVASDAWYAGDVNLATQMGIISGDGNGLFRPNDSVKYEEAVKIMVAALGYQNNYVLAKGGWPTGYLVIASEAGVSKGVKASAGQNAARGIVARLAYNSIDAPMMVSDGYNSDGTYQYKAKDDKQLGYDKLNVYKVDVVVTANSVSSTSGATTVTDANKVKVRYQNNYKIIDDDFSLTNEETVLTNGTNIADFLGYTVTAFLAQDDYKDWNVKAFTVSAKNKTDSIEKLENVKLKSATKYPSTFDKTKDEYVISVFDDDVDTDNTEYTINKEAKVYVNGKYQDTIKNYTIDALSFVGSAELLDNDGDGEFDYIFASKQSTFVVDSIYGSNKKVSLKNGAGYIDLTNFVDGKKGYSYTLTLDGKDIDVKDLKEYDVLTVEGDGTVVGGSATSKNIKIQVARNKVTGVIDEFDGDDYVIDGKTYTVINRSVMPSGTKAGDEGDFYIDVNGKIAMYEKTSATSSNYAMIVNTSTESSVGETYYVLQLFTKDGSIVNYDLADKVSLNGAAKQDASAVYAALTSGKTFGTPKAGTTVTAFADRIVTFKANSSNKITSIDTLTKTTTSGNGQKYSAKTGFSNETVDENTVIFNLPYNVNKTKDDFKITSVSSLQDDTTYDVAYFDIDSSEKTVGLLVITNDVASVGADSNLAFFVRAATIEDDLYKVTFRQGNKEYTVVTTDDTEMVNGYDFGSAEKGDMFAYALDTKGAFAKVESVSTVANANSFGLIRDINNIGKNAKYEYGFVSDIRNNVITLSQLKSDKTFGQSYKRSIPSDAVFTLIDLTVSKTSAKRITGTQFEEMLKTEFVNGELDDDRDIGVFIKYYDDNILDVVLIKGAFAKGMYTTDTLQ